MCIGLEVSKMVQEMGVVGGGHKFFFTHPHELLIGDYPENLLIIGFMVEVDVTF